MDRPLRAHHRDPSHAARVTLLPAFIATLLAVVFTLVMSPATQAASPASTVYAGPSDRKWIALTFDDNTIPDPSLATLKMLLAYRVPTTLFLVGKAVDEFPDVTTMILQGVTEGLFEVGDHSATHVDLTAIPDADLPLQVGGGTEAFRSATGAPVTSLLRPPYGRYNPHVAQVAGDKGFSHIILWDVGVADWTGEPAKAIEDAVVAQAHNGAIVLLHMAAPPAPLPEARRRRWPSWSQGSTPTP
ncbi:MAG: polysaccharide deacetylase family protein [Thermoleophilia bacterium]|jgi:peptidoglycan/xylan/chitin deacetylase (PgdA/CDA1 family)